MYKLVQLKNKWYVQSASGRFFGGYNQKFLAECLLCEMIEEKEIA